jgi:cyclophilin family peptidyl-prolyl cis-trans isomerase
VRGTVGMPKAGDDTGGCQIFVTHLPTPHLDGRYTVFAQVIEGLAVLDTIRIGDTIVRASLERGR